jgi:hypothetical protein
VNSLGVHGILAEETSVAVDVYGEHGHKNSNTSRGEFRLHSGNDLKLGVGMILCCVSSDEGIKSTSLLHLVWQF